MTQHSSERSLVRGATTIALNGYLLLLPICIFLGIEFIGAFVLCGLGSLWALAWVTNVLRAQAVTRSDLWIAVGLVLILAAIVASNLLHGGLDRSLRYMVYYTGAAGLFHFGRTTQSPISPTLLTWFLLANIALGAWLLLAEPVFVAGLSHFDILGQRAVRQFGFTERALGIEINRANGLFLYPTTFAVGAYIIAWLLPPARRGRNWLLAVGATLISLTRTTTLLLAAAPIYELARRSRAAAWAFVVTFLFATALLVLSDHDLSSGILMPKTAVLARSSASTDDRLSSYEASIRVWSRHNDSFGLVGLSESGDPTGLEYTALPLGSHSTIIALLYRFGVTGLLGFTLMLAGMGRAIGWAGNMNNTRFLLMSLPAIFLVEDVLLDPLNWILLFVLLGVASRREAIARSRHIDVRTRSTAALVHG